MSDIAIRVSDVTKQFKLYDNPVTGPLQEFLMPWRPPRHKVFTALRNVSLEVRRGEVVGIIGPNGSGKTTLLKLIAGLLPIDDGSVQISGMITALLALGVGVHSEFNGRENILYGGMLLGVSKREMMRKMDAIIEFAELGQHIHQPFRTYSSGMKARLLFSISMSIDPDILIVDEALATGDGYFVQKSKERIREVCRSGATILFVSHNMTHISELCQRAAVLKSGSVIYDGDVTTAIQRYVGSVHEVNERRTLQEHEDNLSEAVNLGTGEIQIDRMYILAGGQESHTLVIGKSCRICIELTARSDLPEVSLCLELRSYKSGTTFAFVPSPLPEFFRNSSSQYNFGLRAGRRRIVVTIPTLQVGDGSYSIDAELFPGGKGFAFSYANCYCYYKRLLTFQATYEMPLLINRGTLTEVAVDSITIEDIA